ncbi:histidine--tRNA ligase [Alicyclobacillus cycloheptanicus]|uniref:Histidine--tRNA ligase n=1 Tax=Alicyclobacillus cycloheptanicus TaxID=1457 RepID=A0ABT9XE92_9BACL|nr:histidine--tRNA ligase [Alicyclobacillus cycloheptanicus]MDQ0188602.1 histidyl-tRNA synthetase [Alicyclobacillus cycloheptanicus]WDM00715.1 histidine--tRNA ligase [Alicyclobacillus cycloheptanicus]
MLTQRPRGTTDLLPGEVERWQAAEETIRSVFRRYHYGEIRTPVFEHTELFARGVGESTDIVSKEMYTFLDRGERSLTLRPEGTAGVVRAYVENKLYGNPGLTKLYYIEAMFRYEKPQKGRERQFHQYGCEVLGADHPAVDAEVITLNVHLLRTLGLQDLHVELNSVGCGVCRPAHKARMIAALTPHRHELCRDCQQRLDRNPLRIFDCKNEHCQAVLRTSGAPTILEALCDDCRAHFSSVREMLESIGTAYEVNDRLVRGLDYYTRTAWEITVPSYGTVAGGGRYNGLVAMIGGPETPGIGFAGGMERALMLLAEQGRDLRAPTGLDVFVTVADEAGEPMAMRLLQDLRAAGVTADRDYLGRSLKAQFKAADREAAKFVAIIGETEVQQGSVSLKDLQSGEQVALPVSDIVSYLAEKVGVQS